MHKILYIEYYSQTIVHIILCIEYYAYNTIHKILCIEHYAHNTMYRILCLECYAKNNMHRILCIKYFSENTMHIILSIEYFKQYIVDIKLKQLQQLGAILRFFKTYFLFLGLYTEPKMNTWDQKVTSQLLMSSPLQKRVNAKHLLQKFVRTCRSI